MARAKFKVESVTKFAKGTQIVMHPVTHGSPENEKFYQCTPGGELKLEILNQEVASQFEPGKEYYIDIASAG